MVIDCLYTVGFLAAVGQTPGQMAVGIRVVDRRTGEPPTCKQALVRWLVSTLLRHVPRLLAPPLPTADGERRRALRDEMIRLELEHGDDRQRLNQELLELYERFRGSPAKGCGRVALSQLGVLADLVVMLADPLGRGIQDRAAGTVVVETARWRA